MKFILAAFLTLSVLCPGASARAEPKGIAVLELFTSQVCPDCKLADEILGNIVNDSDDNIIALGCHVIFLDGEEVRDKLSREFCDERQSKYMIANVLQEISVPHMIINGKFDTIGDVEKTVRAGAKMGVSTNSVTRISLGLRNDFLDITLPEMSFDAPVDVWLFAYDKLQSANIGIKQDVGETVNHVNAVNHLEKLTSWDGSYKNIAHSLKDIPANGYAVIAQYANHTDIIAAGKVEN